MFKGILLALPILLALLGAMTHEAHAASQSAKTVRIRYTDAPVSSTAYTEIDSSTAKALVGISVFNTGPNPVVLSVGAAGFEVEHYTIPQGTLPGNDYAGAPTGLYNAVPMFIPIRVAQARRLAVKAKNSTNNRGELQITEIYD